MICLNEGSENKERDMCGVRGEREGDPFAKRLSQMFCEKQSAVCVAVFTCVFVFVFSVFCVCFVVLSKF